MFSLVSGVQLYAVLWISHVFWKVRLTPVSGFLRESQCCAQKQHLRALADVIAPVSYPTEQQYADCSELESR